MRHANFSDNLTDAEEEASAVNTAFRFCFYPAPLPKFKLQPMYMSHSLNHSILLAIVMH